MAEIQETVGATSGQIDISQVMSPSEIAAEAGKQLVVVKRTDVDIDSKIGRSLALADNATSQANLEFDEEALESISSNYNIDLGDWGLQPDFSDEPDTPIIGITELKKLKL